MTIHRPLTVPVSIVVPAPGSISTDPDSSYDPQVELCKYCGNPWGERILRTSVSDANSWVLFLPDLIIDAKAGCMWKLQLNLNVICELLEDRVRISCWTRGLGG